MNAYILVCVRACVQLCSYTCSNVAVETLGWVEFQVLECPAGLIKNKPVTLPEIATVGGYFGSLGILKHYVAQVDKWRPQNNGIFG